MNKPSKKRFSKPKSGGGYNRNKNISFKKSNHEVSEKKDDGKVRLNKCIADAGVCSRREADKLIANGEIWVNGKVVTEMGYRVAPTDTVKYNKKTLKRQRFVYILLNKPKDYITTSNDEKDRKIVLDLVSDACNERIYPVGRLDRNTTGLLLLTNDGDLTKKLTHPSYNVTKKYVAEFYDAISKDKMDELVNGINLEDGFSKFDSVEYGDKGHNKRKIIVNIHSGKNRIVRRMFEAVGHEVIKLDRVEFAGLKKGSLTRSKWRILTKKEIGFLKMVAKKD